MNEAKLRSSNQVTLYNKRSQAKKKIKLRLNMPYEYYYKCVASNVTLYMALDHSL